MYKDIWRKDTNTKSDVISAVVWDPWGYSKAKVSDPLQALWAASWWPLGYVRKGGPFALLGSSVQVVYVWYCLLLSVPACLSYPPVLSWSQLFPDSGHESRLPFLSLCTSYKGAQFRKKGCCGPLSCIQRSSHGFSSRLFRCYAKQNSKHRCLTRMSCGLFGTFLINISSEHCFVALWKYDL